MPRDSLVEEIKSRIDIVDLIQSYVPLQRAGKSWKGRCPFHEDRTPSFHVSPGIQRYKCYGCGKGGDIFTFIQERENVEFPEALRLLAQRAGVTLREYSPSTSSPTAPLRDALEEARGFFIEQLKASQQAKELLARRGVSEEMRERFELGFVPNFGDALATTLQKRNVKLAEAAKAGLVDKGPDGGYYDKFRGRLMFPVRDENGRLIGFGGRAMGDGQPKYLNSPDTALFQKRRVLYAFHFAKERIRETGRALLVEGYMDVIACHAAGLTHAVATLGTAMSEDHAKLLQRWQAGVTILFDADEAGINAAMRAADIAAEEGVEARIARLPQGEDPDSYVRGSGAAGLLRLVDEAVSVTQFRLDRLEERIDTATAEGANRYVEEGAKVLAGLENAVERERYLEQVGRRVSTYSHSPSQALGAVRSRIEALRKGRGRAAAGGKAAVNLPVTRPTAADKAEMGLIRAVADPKWADPAWELLQPDLFADDERRELVEALRSAFPEGPVGAREADIIETLDDERLKDRFTTIAMRDGEPLSEQVLRDYHAELQRRRRLAQRRLAAGRLSKETSRDDPAWQEFESLLGE